MQSNEVGSANACELEGLKRCIGKIGADKIAIIVTDRHRGVAKFLRECEQLSHVLHLYDVWHLAKGLQLYR